MFAILALRVISAQSFAWHVLALRMDNCDIEMYSHPGSWSLKQLQPSSCHVGAEGPCDDETEQHHDLLPPRLGLVLQGLLCVIGGPGGVLHRALHVSVDPTESN